MKHTYLYLAALTVLLFVSATYAQDGGPTWTPMYEGVDVTSYERAEPLLKIVAARIDTTAPGVEFTTTTPHPDFELGKRETIRQTTAGFLKESGAAVAVNGNFYLPFNATTIATPGDADLLGLGVCDGFVESEPVGAYPSFVVKKSGEIAIHAYQPGDDLSDIQIAVSGNKIVLQNGEIVKLSDPTHPRTAIGYSQDKRYVYLLTIDGRQAGFSVGASYEQVAAEMQYVGAYDALNLDGGGSTTFVLRDANAEPVVINRPCNSTKDRLRFNANAIGVKANGAPQKGPLEFRFY